MAGWAFPISDPSAKELSSSSGKLFRTKLWIRGLLSVSPASSRRLALNPTTTSSSFAVREAGAWLQLRRWPRRAIGPVTMSLGVSKDRSTRIGTAAPPAAGRRPVFPGFRPSVCPRLIQTPFAQKRSKRPNKNAKASKTGKTRAALLRQTTAQRSPRPKPDHEGPPTQGSQAKTEEVLAR